MLPVVVKNEGYGKGRYVTEAMQRCMLLRSVFILALPLMIGVISLSLSRFSSRPEEVPTHGPMTICT